MKFLKQENVSTIIAPIYQQYWKIDSQSIYGKTRMHSNRMRTVRCSGRLGGLSDKGVSARGCLPIGVLT